MGGAKFFALGILIWLIALDVTDSWLANHISRMRAYKKQSKIPGPVRVGSSRNRNQYNDECEEDPQYWHCNKDRKCLCLLNLNGTENHGHLVTESEFEQNEAYSFFNPSSGCNLDILSAKAVHGQAISAYLDTSKLSQTNLWFRVTKEGDGFRLSSLLVSSDFDLDGSRFLLVVSEVTTGDKKTAVFLQRFTGSQYQQWTAVRDTKDPTKVHLQNIGSGKFLFVKGASTAAKMNTLKSDKTLFTMTKL